MTPAIRGAAAALGAAGLALPIGSGRLPVGPPPEPTPPVEPHSVSAEVRAWIGFHGIDPGCPLRGLCRRLDALTPDELREFDRQSPSRIGYRDVAAELHDLAAELGPGATVADVLPPGGRTSRGPPTGR